MQKVSISFVVEIDDLSQKNAAIMALGRFVPDGATDVQIECWTLPPEIGTSTSLDRSSVTGG